MASGKEKSFCFDPQHLGELFLSHLGFPVRSALNIRSIVLGLKHWRGTQSSARQKLGNLSAQWYRFCRCGAKIRFAKQVANARTHFVRPAVLSNQ